MKQTICPMCGNKETDNNQGECYCYECKTDFWESEALPKDYRKQGLKPVNELMNELEGKK